MLSSGQSHQNSSNVCVARNIMQSWVRSPAITEWGFKGKQQIKGSFPAVRILFEVLAEASRERRLELSEAE